MTGIKKFFKPGLTYQIFTNDKGHLGNDAYTILEAYDDGLILLTAPDQLGRMFKHWLPANQIISAYINSDEEL